MSSQMSSNAPNGVPRQQQLLNTTNSSSSPATPPVSTPTNFLERNVEIDELVARGVQTWKVGN